ncbi:MAG TPA: glycosyltransferase family A protein, partial [Terriglobales bacterium]|nr:glycosyltransferase family A protein [Terriglobales bacterium]
MAKITFGILALNAQPLLEYNLRALYPYAHQILVVEGATRPAASLSVGGHSSDDTVKMLATFKKKKDPEGKLQVVTAAEDGYADGLWPEKDEMSQAFAKRADGDWLWQVDSDEFYKAQDMEAVMRLLDERPNISRISFPFYEFWGGFDYFTTGTWYLHEFTEVRRIFRWRSGYSYSSHRPPTVLNETGHELDGPRWITGGQMRKRGIFMYHYSYVFPKQAQ